MGGSCRLQGHGHARSCERGGGERALLVGGCEGAGACGRAWRAWRFAVPLVHAHPLSRLCASKVAGRLHGVHTPQQVRLHARTSAQAHVHMCVQVHS